VSNGHKESLSDIYTLNVIYNCLENDEIILKEGEPTVEEI